MHTWGDEWPHWKELNKAETELYFWGRKVGRIGGQIKEKYGGLRWYAKLGGANDIYELACPGYVTASWCPLERPFLSWLNKLSKPYMCFLSLPVYKYRCFMYGFAYHMAVKRYPHLYKEILDCVDHEEFLFKNEKKIMPVWETLP